MPEHVVNRFCEIIRGNRQTGVGGIFSVCSAHPAVLKAAMRQAGEDGSILCIESTSNQVNQFGGYTGMTPARFWEYVASIARKNAFPPERILLGGDHLGPYPWRRETSQSGMEKARMLVRDCVLAGYTKIHLDASMACADDTGGQITDETVAARAAELCRAAEDAWAKLPSTSPRLLYVIGTEVPVPGGETSADRGPLPTEVDQMQKTLATAQAAFATRGLRDAWERVIGLVVQPGVEFGNDTIFGYDREKAGPLSRNVPPAPALVYEAHSTDYQTGTALRNLVKDHFAILKVGPWLTFAYREALFALGLIEREWLGRRASVRVSRVREALEAAMLENPVHWKPYYPDREPEAYVARQYSYSDRCRYYWPETSVQKEVDQLVANLSGGDLPMTLLSQYLPAQYEKVRLGTVANRPHDLIEDRIRGVLRLYSSACGTRNS